MSNTQDNVFIFKIFVYRCKSTLTAFLRKRNHFASSTENVKLCQTLHCVCYHCSRSSLSQILSVLEIEITSLVLSNNRISFIKCVEYFSKKKDFFVWNVLLRQYRKRKFQKTLATSSLSTCR